MSDRSAGDGDLTAAEPSDFNVRRAVLRAALVGVVLSVILIGVGSIGQLIVFDGTVGDADQDVVEWIAEHRTAVLDRVATIGSTLADTWTVIGVMVGSIGMLLVTDHRRCAALIFVGVAIEFATFLVVGFVIDRPRPDVEVLHSLPSTSSFPSGHAAIAVVVYGSLVVVARALRPATPTSVWAVPCGFAIVVASSRVYEGVHYPTDVVVGLLLGVGALLGAAWATGFVEFDGRRLRWSNRVRNRND